MAPRETTAVARAEELAETLLPDRTPKKRMLVIVNPYATTVSDRLKNLVVYALESGTRSRPWTPRSPTTPRRSAARRPRRATTWWWPSAATAR